MSRILDQVVDACVPLSYWWCYQSDRPVDQKHPQRMDIGLIRDPELVELVRKYMASGNNQYAPMQGVPVLRQRIS